MKQSLTQRIKAYFQKRPNEWINGARIEELAMQATHYSKGIKVNYKASNASRRLREAESGKDSRGKPCEKFLIADHTRGKSVWYKYAENFVPEKKTSLYDVVELEDGTRIARMK